jgi:hypothetical protein
MSSKLQLIVPSNEREKYVLEEAINVTSMLHSKIRKFKSFNEKMTRSFELHDVNISIAAALLANLEEEYCRYVKETDVGKAWERQSYIKKIKDTLVADVEELQCIEVDDKYNVAELEDMRRKFNNIIDKRIVALKGN